MSHKIAVLAVNEYVYNKWLESMFTRHCEKFKYIDSIEELAGGEVFMQWIEIHNGEQSVNPNYDQRFHEELQLHIIS